MTHTLQSIIANHFIDAMNKRDGLTLTRRQIAEVLCTTLLNIHTGNPGEVSVPSIIGLLASRGTTITPKEVRACIKLLTHRHFGLLNITRLHCPLKNECRAYAMDTRCPVPAWLTTGLAEGQTLLIDHGLKMPNDHLAPHKSAGIPSAKQFSATTTPAPTNAAGAVHDDHDHDDAVVVNAMPPLPSLPPRQRIRDSEREREELAAFDAWLNTELDPGWDDDDEQNEQFGPIMAQMPGEKSAPTASPTPFIIPCWVPPPAACPF